MIGEMTNKKSPLYESFMPELSRGLQAIFDLVESLRPQLQSFAETVVPALEKFNGVLTALSPRFDAMARVDWVSVRRRLDELPSKSKDAMSLALTQGWFFGWHDGLQSLMELIDKLGSATPSNVDDIMAAYYRANLKPFSEELTAEYPGRADAINAAVHAHNSLLDGAYFLSIPVFIAQGDGLLAEVTGIESPMAKAPTVLRTRYAADAELLDLLNPILDLKDSVFMMSSPARQVAAQAAGKSFDALNRHQVMHGERSDYGTELNSLKAFSFLVFAGLHVPAVLTR